jgi:hypothetical protein
MQCTQTANSRKLQNGQKLSSCKFLLVAVPFYQVTRRKRRRRRKKQKKKKRRIISRRRKKRKKKLCE